MSRISLVLIFGFVCAIGGIALALGAHALATTWQQIDSNAWGGETDPRQEATIRTIGYMFLPFGLALVTTAAYYALRQAGRTRPADPSRPSAI